MSPWAKEQVERVRRMVELLHIAAEHERALLVGLAARIAVEGDLVRTLDRCTDQMALFAARYDAGDRGGAALALRAWIARVS